MLPNSNFWNSSSGGGGGGMDVCPGYSPASQTHRRFATGHHDHFVFFFLLFTLEDLGETLLIDWLECEVDGFHCYKQLAIYCIDGDLD